MNSIPFATLGENQEFKTDTPLRGYGLTAALSLIRPIAIEKNIILLYNTPMPYKVIETSSVTDEEIERILNEWTGKGYSFESIQFVMFVSSKRPTMAFLFFTKKE